MNHKRHLKKYKERARVDYHSLLREVVILMVALYSKTVKDPVILERIQ